MTDKQNITIAAFAKKFHLMMNEPMKNHTSFRVGGPADLLALPGTVQELKNLLARASDHDIPVTLLGSGTNVLVSDKGIRGLVIITTRLTSGIRITTSENEKTRVSAEAGERLSTVCRFAVNHSLSGLEFAAGIPGTLGGAIAMNAGTGSGDISGILDDILILDKKTLSLHTIEKKNLKFSYRHLRVPGIIVSATLVLKPGNREKTEKLFDQHLIRKKTTQPVSSASAGCFFKNPAQGMPAGELIEKSGLKGMKINDAMVSQIHANYIVNTGNATCKDILLLVRHIQKTVFNQYQVQLETEVRMEGEY